MPCPLFSRSLCEYVCPSGSLHPYGPLAGPGVRHVHRVSRILPTWPPHFHLRLSATSTASFMPVLVLRSSFLIRSFRVTCIIFLSIFLWQILIICGENFRLERGVKQGDPLSPKLFTSLLEHQFRKLKCGYECGININAQYESLN